MRTIIIGITIRHIVIPTHITRETRLWQTQFDLLTCLIIDSALCCMHILASCLLKRNQILCRRTFSCLCLKLDTAFYTTLIQRNFKRTRVQITTTLFLKRTRQHTRTSHLVTISCNAKSHIIFSRTTYFQPITTASPGQFPVTIIQVYLIWSFRIACLDGLVVHIIYHLAMLVSNIYRKCFCLFLQTKGICHRVDRERQSWQLLLMVRFANYAHGCRIGLSAYHILRHHIVRIVYPLFQTAISVKLQVLHHSAYCLNRKRTILSAYYLHHITCGGIIHKIVWIKLGYRIIARSPIEPWRHISQVKISQLTLQF